MPSILGLWTSKSKRRVVGSSCGHKKRIDGCLYCHQAHGDPSYFGMERPSVSSLATTLDIPSVRQRTRSNLTIETRPSIQSTASYSPNLDLDSLKIPQDSLKSPPVLRKTTSMVNLSQRKPVPSFDGDNGRSVSASATALPASIQSAVAAQTREEEDTTFTDYRHLLTTDILKTPRPLKSEKSIGASSHPVPVPVFAKQVEEASRIPILASRSKSDTYQPCHTQLLGKPCALTVKEKAASFESLQRPIKIHTLYESAPHLPKALDVHNKENVKTPRTKSRQGVPDYPATPISRFVYDVEKTPLKPLLLNAPPPRSASFDATQIKRDSRRISNVERRQRNAAKPA